MDQSKQFLRKTLQILLPVSLLSFLLSYSSALSYFFHYFNLQFSALLFSLSAHILERKYMFLICNGILAFLAKNSSVFRWGSPSESCSNGDSEKKNDSEAKPVPELLETVALFQNEEVSTGSSIVSSGKDTRAKEDVEENLDDRGRKSGGSLRTESEDDDGGEDEDEDVGEEGISLVPTSSAEGNEVDLSTEELNRKFEEFIRKMKEEIRIETQQQLIAV